MDASKSNKNDNNGIFDIFFTKRLVNKSCLYYNVFSEICDFFKMEVVR